MSNPALARAVVEFNYLPALGAHASWLEELAPAPVVRELAKCARARHHLSATLRRRHDLDDSWDFDFGNPAKRLALLRAPSLERLVRLAGALLLADPIARVIDRAGHRALGDILGPRDYAFVLGKRLLRPDVLAAVNTTLPPSLIGEKILPGGIACLAGALPRASEAFECRCRLRMPRTWATHFIRARRHGRPLGLAGEKFCLWLAAEVYPEWTLLCS